MRFIVWGINYAPELTGIAPFNTGLCDFLRQQGHQVEMVTTFPYYPFWAKIPGDRGQVYRTDEIDGVWVHRCWHYVPRRATTIRRIWHEMSFGLTSLLRVLFLARPDVYVIVSPPLLLGLFASFISKLKQRPYVFHVQDLQPDAAIGLGMVRVGWFTRCLYRVESWSYRHAAVVSGISHEMLAAFARKDVPSQRRVLFPNWIRWYGRNTAVIESDSRKAERARAFREKFNISQDDFIAAYSGNLGRKQGLDTLLEAAQRLKMGTGTEGKGPVISILVVGDGVMRAEIEAQVRKHALANVRLMPLLVEHDYHGLLAAADVSLILQAPGTGQYFLPSKLLSVLSVGSPVLAAADPDSALAAAVTVGKFGTSIPPGDPTALADALRALAAHPSRIEGFRRCTKWVHQYAGESVLRDFERHLKQIVEETGTGAEDTREIPLG